MLVVEDDWSPDEEMLTDYYIRKATERLKKVSKVLQNGN